MKQSDSVHYITTVQQYSSTHQQRMERRRCCAEISKQESVQVNYDTCVFTASEKHCTGIKHITTRTWKHNDEDIVLIPNPS